MSMPSHVDLVAGMNVIRIWSFWFLIHVIIVFAIIIIAAIVLNTKTKKVNKIKGHERSNYVSKSREYNKKAV